MRSIINGFTGSGWRVVMPMSARAAAFAGTLLLIQVSAFGTAIGIGQGNTAGTVLVNSSGIVFSSFLPVGPNTGSYAGMTSTVQGSLPGAPNLAPNLTDWAEFAGTVSGLIKFDLQTLNPGFGTLVGCGSNTIGSLCTPTGSPITLAQVGLSSVSISLSGNGRAYTGTNATSSPTVVSFTSQNNVPGTISGILAAVNSANGFTNSVSATYSTSAPATVPEPMTLSMMGFGLVALGLVARRRKS